MVPNESASPEVRSSTPSLDIPRHALEHRPGIIQLRDDFFPGEMFTDGDGSQLMLSAARWPNPFDDDDLENPFNWNNWFDENEDQTS